MNSAEPGVTGIMSATLGALLAEVRPATRAELSLVGGTVRG